MNGLVAAASVVIIVFGLKLASDILAPVLFATTLAILCAPLLRWLERHGLPTPVALLVMIVGLVVFLGGMLLVVYISLLKLQERLPTYQALLAERMAPLVDALGNIGVTSDDLPTDWANGAAVIGAAISAISAIISSAVGIVFFLFTLSLMLIESSNIGRKLRQGMRPDTPFKERLFGYTHEIQQQYKIQCFSNFLSATVLTVEFFLFQIDFALLWGFLAFVLGFIPNVGLIIACLPAILLAFILHGPGTAAVVLILAIILNAAMDNLVTPHFMASGLQLPVLVSFLSFLFWTWVFGFLGALLAIPATLFVRTLLASDGRTTLMADFLSASGPEVAAPDIVVPAGVPGDGT